MRQRVCLLALIFGLLAACAGVSAAQPEYQLGGGLGVTQIGDQFYLTTTVQPDLAIGKFGVGLELTLNFDKDGIRAEDWDTTQKSIARSIRYVRWGRKGDPLYLQFGTLSNAVIGTGVLVDNYMNVRTQDIQAGQRRLGLAADVDFGLGGVEALVNDTLDPSLYAGRVYVRPARFVPFLSPMEKLSVGMSMATDKRTENPYNGLKATALDVYYPIHPAFIVFAHTASIEGHGNGRGAGIRGDLGPVSYVAEARNYDADFVPSLISKKYEQDGIDWIRYPADGTRTEGYLLGADLNLLEGDLVVGVKQEFNPASQTGSVPRVTGELALKGQMLKMFTGGRDASLSASYTKELVDPATGDANGYLHAKASIAIVRGANLNYSYDVVYPYDHSEPQRNMSAGVSFGF